MPEAMDGHLCSSFDYNVYQLDKKGLEKVVYTLFV